MYPGEEGMCTPILRERTKFRKLQPGMLTTLSSQFEVMLLLLFFLWFFVHLIFNYFVCFATESRL